MLLQQNPLKDMSLKFKYDTVFSSALPTHRILLAGDVGGGRWPAVALRFASPACSAATSCVLM